MNICEIVMLSMHNALLPDKAVTLVIRVDAGHALCYLLFYIYFAMRIPASMDEDNLF